MRPRGPIVFAWNFTGVIENNNWQAVFHIINKVIMNRGIDTVSASEDHVIKLYGSSLKTYFKSLFSWYENKDICKLVKEAENISPIIVQAYAGANFHAYHTISEVKDNNHKNIVVSNSSQNFIEWIVEYLGLTNSFDSIIGIDTEERRANGVKKAGRKANAIIDYAKRIKAGKIIVIGDTKEDVEAGFLCLNEIDSRPYFYFNGINDFQMEQVEYILDSKFIISDLRDVLNELQIPSVV